MIIVSLNVLMTSIHCQRNCFSATCTYMYVLPTPKALVSAVPMGLTPLEVSRPTHLATITQVGAWLGNALPYNVHRLLYVYIEQCVGGKRAFDPIPHIGLPRPFTESRCS